MGKTSLAITIVFNDIERDPRVLKSLIEMPKYFDRSVAFGYKIKNNNSSSHSLSIGTSEVFICRNVKTQYSHILATSKDRLEQYRMQQLFFSGFISHSIHQIITEMASLKTVFLHSHDMHSIFIGSCIQQFIEDRFSSLKVIWLHDFHELVTGVEFTDSDTASFFINDERKYACKPAHASTVSPHLATKLNSLYGIEPIVLANSMLYSNSLSCIHSSDISARSVLQIPSTSPIIIYSGSVTPQRRVKLPLKAMCDIQDLHYVIVTNQSAAENEYLDQILTQSMKLGLTDRLHLLPYAEPARAWEVFIGCNASLSMLPRYPNGDVALPNKLFDSIRASVPILSSDNPQLKEFIEAHRCGMTFKADSPDDLSIQLQKLLRSTFTIDPADFIEFAWDNQFRGLMRELGFTPNASHLEAQEYLNK